uniref:Uncharacterized protein n=1 Tax=Parascaris equorum TaxID=6256 RepID=A0A914RTE1_PAREQ
MLLGIRAVYHDFRVEEFYVAPAATSEDEDVPASVYASSGKYIDPISGLRNIFFKYWSHRPVAEYIMHESEHIHELSECGPSYFTKTNLHELLFIKYLEERGFNAKFCQDLVSYATHYEHSRYVALLGKIKAFVSK